MKDINNERRDESYASHHYENIRGATGGIARNVMPVPVFDLHVRIRRIRVEFPLKKEIVVVLRDIGIFTLKNAR